MVSKLVVWGLVLWDLNQGTPIRIPIPCIKRSQEAKPPIYHQLTTISATRLKCILRCRCCRKQSFFNSCRLSGYSRCTLSNGRQKMRKKNMVKYKDGWILRQMWMLVWGGTNRNCGQFCIGKSCLLDKIMLFLQLITPISGLICWYSWPIYKPTKTCEKR